MFKLNSLSFTKKTLKGTWNKATKFENPAQDLIPNEKFVIFKLRECVFMLCMCTLWYANACVLNKSHAHEFTQIYEHIMNYMC